MTSPPSDTNHHQRFYFSDGSLYLLVDQLLYCVHRSLFEIHASRFPACGLDASDDEIHFLGGVTMVDFDRLLTCLYPRALLVAESTTTDEWMSILKLASKWGFDTLHERAISEIERLASPVDMIVLGRQHNIPDILLLGYVTLCQDTTPLSSEEGRRLGVEDVINIYRIRYELYPSAIIPVSFEEALEKVQISVSKGKETGHHLEAEQLDVALDDEASEWADAVSVAASQTSLAEAVASFTADDSDSRVVESNEQLASPIPLVEKDAERVDSASTLASVEGPRDQPGLVSEQKQYRNTISFSPDTLLESPLSVEISESQPGLEQSDVNAVSPPPETPPDYPSYTENCPESEGQLDVFLLGGDVPESSESADQNFLCLDVLTANNYKSVAQNIIRWFKATPNNQTLYQLTRSIVERVIAEQIPTGQVNILIRLCKLMANHLPSEVKSWDSEGKVTSGGTVFKDYLGDLCCTNLKTIAASAGAGGERTVRIRRRRLIEFIGNLMTGKGMSLWTPDIVDRWVTALLDANNEEDIATLCALMMRVGPTWDTSKKKNKKNKNKKKKKYQAYMNSWFERMNKVAQKTSQPRVRTLLQNVIRRRSLG